MDGTRKAGLALALFTLGGIAALQPVQAQPGQTFTGTFAHDNSIFLTGFTVAAPTAYTFYTTSYAGGLNADGTTTTRGGFDAFIEVMNGSGHVIWLNDDGTSVHVAVDPTTHNAWDAYLKMNLAPGSYSVLLTQYGNNLNGDDLTTGFTEAGSGNDNYTSIFAPNGPGTSSAPFIEQDGAQRTGNYTLNLQSSPVPEASTTVSMGLLLILGLGGAAVSARRRKSSC